MPAREKAWWESCSLDEFKSTCDALEVQEQEVLIGELQGRLAQIDLQNQGADRKIPNWREEVRRRKRNASVILERRTILKKMIHTSHLKARDENQEWKATLIEMARVALDEDDLRLTLKIVIDLLEGNHALMREAAADEGERMDA